jgi:hypothetical protein
MNPRRGARLLAGGRMAFGAALLLAPETIAASWVGEHAKSPAVRSLARSIGVRDIVLGMIALHTIDHPQVGPRWQATCASVDTVDLLAALAARSDLPASGLAGTILLAGGAAAAGFQFSSALKRS